MERLIFFCFAGTVFSIYGAYCVRGFTKKPEDAKFLGRIHWSIVGVLGYIAIGLSVRMHYIYLTYALVSIALLTTIWLFIFRAIKMKMMCPACLVIYVLNILMAHYVFFIWQR